MNDEIRWFACLCIRNQICNAQACRMIRKSFGDREFDVLAYAEKMVELGICEELELLQNLLDETCERVDAGEAPPEDPFLQTSSKKSGRKLTTRPPIPAPKPEEQASPVQNSSSSPPAEISPPSPTPAPQPKTPPSAPSPEPGTASVAEDPPSAPETAGEDPTPPPASLHQPRRPTPVVVPADGLDPALPDFAAVTAYNPNQQRAAMIGLLKYCQEAAASDLHLSADARPFFRKDRENRYLAESPLDPEASRILNTCLLTPEQGEYFQREQDYDFALAFSTGERFRANLMIHKDGLAGTYRMVPRRIQSLEELGFENGETIRKLLAYHNGLILVTGPVGSGKTTTLAALVHEMNENREDHIITVEEPIEFVQVSNNCSVTQRGVGPHTQSFRSALKGALRQDPDIIVIGEMRDLETIEMAISASETGHLVIGTMHTSDAGTTLNRLLDVFPPAQQAQIRAMVAESLRGIICQRLLPGINGGLVLACELLLKNTAVSSLIREGKTQGLGNIMETGKADGMIQMDASILKLSRDRKISAQVARDAITNEMLKLQVN